MITVYILMELYIEDTNVVCVSEKKSRLEKTKQNLETVRDKKYYTYYIIERLIDVLVLNVREGE